MQTLLDALTTIARERPGLALFLSLAIGLPGFVVTVYQLLWIPAATLYHRYLSKKENLSGVWLLAIYRDDEPYKIDRYRIRHRGNRLRGRIERVLSEEDEDQLATRRYSFAGFHRSGEIIYAFWPDSPAVHSYGCCNLRREYDYTYKGYYYVPLGKRSGKRRHTIRLTRNPTLVRELEELYEPSRPSLFERARALVGR